MTRSRTPMLFKNQYVANAAARVERSVGGVQMTFLVGRFGDPSTSFPFKTRVEFSPYHIRAPPIPFKAGCRRRNSDIRFPQIRSRCKPLELLNTLPPLD